jgi:Ca2+-binding RTX toxin-like protein
MATAYSFTPIQRAALEALLSPFQGVQSMEEGSGSCDDSDQGEGSKPDASPGTNAADLLVGGVGMDNLVGLNGDDTLRGLQGKDWLYGDNGNDLLDAGEGRDFLHGGNGDDELRGGKGRDDLFGENGNDLLTGGCGPDLMDGGRGDDVLFGGNSPDTYAGALGRDVFVLALPGGEGGHGGGGEIAPTLGPLAHEEEEGDVVTDFEQGVDHLALAGSLAFDQLRFAGNRIYVVMDEVAGISAPLASPSMPGSETEGLGRLLATLTGFNTTQLSEADFITWADISMG